MNQSRSDQGRIHMKPSTYFRGLTLERVAGLQPGLENEERWLVKGWYKISNTPEIVREIETNLRKQD